MSKVFRRPMFRKGGGVNMNGIMSNIEDRQNYAIGDTAKILEEQAGMVKSSGLSDPLTGLLLTTSQNLLTKPSTGNVFADIGQSVNVKDFIKAARDRDEERRALRVKGALTDVEQMGAEKLARIKNQNKDFFAAQTPEAQFAELISYYKDSTIPEIKNNATDLASFRIRHKNQPYFELDYEYSNQSKKFEPVFDSIPPGAITFDVTKGKAYRRNKDGSFQELDPINLKPLEPVDGTE